MLAVAPSAMTSRLMKETVMQVDLDQPDVQGNGMLDPPVIALQDAKLHVIHVAQN